MRQASSISVPYFNYKYRPRKTTTAQAFLYVTSVEEVLLIVVIFDKFLPNKGISILEL